MNSKRTEEFQRKKKSSNPSVGPRLAINGRSYQKTAISETDKFGKKFWI